MEGIKQKLYGFKTRRTCNSYSGTGLGKSSVTRELEHWLINQAEDNVGVIALEEDWKRTVDGILSLKLMQDFIDQEREKFDKETIMQMFDKVFEEDRVFIHAHFGTNEIDDIFAKLRYLIVGCDCRVGCSRPFTYAC